MKWQLLGIVLMGCLNSSFKSLPRVGLLTDDFGIVTGADLDQEESRCTGTEPFPPKTNLCFQYWQCLSTENIYIDCENIGNVGDFQHAGLATFWIQDNENIHHYFTRRNFDIDTCRDWKDAWKNIVEGETTVCLSGNFIEMSREDEPGSPTGTHYYWIIDRMKSPHGEWSYFLRDLPL